MRRAFLLLMTVAVLVAGFRFLAACLDVERIIVVRDAATGDAGCLLCVEQSDNCAGLIDECKADPRCKPAYECIVREACFDLPTLDDKINCGLPCAQDAGIQSATDPVIATYLVGLVGCAQQKCAFECNLSEGGVGL